MGCGIKLIIGRDTGRKEKDCDYSTNPPRASGKQCTYFMEYATVDLAKVNYDGAFHKAMTEWKNKDNLHFWFKYGSDGDTRVTEDKHGDQWIPQKISVVLAALIEELGEDGDYRRIKWAIALLNSMKSDIEDICVWIYGC